MSVTARVRKTAGFDDSLMILRNGGLSEIIHIDRTYYGPQWNEEHGMEITEMVETENGEWYDIWRKGSELVSAIPKMEEKAK